MPEITKDDKAKTAKDCLSFNKNATEVFVTGDLTCFFSKNLAANHASKLEDKTIEHFEREPVAAANVKEVDD